MQTNEMNRLKMEVYLLNERVAYLERKVQEMCMTKDEWIAMQNSMQADNGMDTMYEYFEKRGELPCGNNPKV
jgi:hypothetical protein